MRHPNFVNHDGSNKPKTMLFVIGLVIGGIAGFVGGFLFVRNNKSASERANAAIDAAKGK